MGSMRVVCHYQTHLGQHVDTATDEGVGSSGARGGGVTLMLVFLLLRPPAGLLKLLLDLPGVERPATDDNEDTFFAFCHLSHECCQWHDTP